jgi:hypothetical protein
VAALEVSVDWVEMFPIRLQAVSAGAGSVVGRMEDDPKEGCPTYR